MNTFKARRSVQYTWRLAALAILAFLATSIYAQDGPQSRRFLFIFETSPILKKNLSAVDGTLARLFEYNLQNQLHEQDDVAVWTVDEGLHAAPPNLRLSWDSANAATYVKDLGEFLGKQHFSKHASLGPVQPSMNRIVDKSEHLTIIIFCDSQSHLQGTPFDDGVNGIITNVSASVKSPIPVIIVLRAYRGEYVGSSVNEAAPLNFPKFPSPPKPASSTAENPAPAPRKIIAGPVVTPIPALIIVGTNAGTNISILTSPPPHPQPPPVIKPPPATNASISIPTPPPPPPPPPPTAVAIAAPNQTPAVAPPAAPLPAPTPVQPPPPPSTPAVIVAKPPTAPSATAPSNTVVVATGTAGNGGSYVVALAVGLGALASAIAIVLRRVMQSRRPRNSLITSSMYDDRRQPPQK